MSHSCNEESWKKDHVHELLGSTFTAEVGRDCHSHRFALTTGEAIPSGQGNHVHDVTFKTDTYEDHEHGFCGRTSEAIRVGDRHVHFLAGCVRPEDGHKHEFRAATLIDNPTGD